MARLEASLDQQRYEDLRTRLIDRTRRNRLLDLRHSGRAVLLRIVNVAPEQVAQLLLDGKALPFACLPDPGAEPLDERQPRFVTALSQAIARNDAYLAALAEIGDDDPAAWAKRDRAGRALRDQIRAQLGLPPRPERRTIDRREFARANGIAPEEDLAPAADRKAQSETERALQTLLFADELRARLGTLQKNAVTVEEETGVSTLHLAIGFLQWLEADHTEAAYTSPLLLLPMALHRVKRRGREEEYSLTAVDEAPQTNLSLELMLRETHGLSLPAFDAETAEPIESYLAAVAVAIQPHPRWRIRRFMTLAPFSFVRIAMYRDLDPANWKNGGGPTAHPLVCAALRQAPAGGGSDIQFPDEQDIDDPEVVRHAPLLVHDADSSQHSAIIDAMQGHNLAIEGPPGTGKSQTIANLIANELHAGKTVLFVAEKLAALEVVKKRLDSVGLGQFCLSLHAAGARSAAVIDALRERDALRPRFVESADVLERRMQRARGELREHRCNARAGGPARRDHARPRWPACRTRPGAATPSEHAAGAGKRTASADRRRCSTRRA